MRENDVEIFKLREKGETLASIAKKYNARVEIPSKRAIDLNDFIMIKQNILQIHK